MKCFSKKLIAVMLMSTIVIGLIMPLKLFASSDTTAPSINSMSLDKNNINAPDKVKISLNVTDDISGIRDVRIFYYNPSRSQQLCAHMSEKSDNIWEGYLNFDQYVEEGTYTLWEIIATDAAGNQKDIYDTNLPSKFKSQTIKVVNTIGSDMTAPSINSMSLDKNNINAPDKVKISLNVTDDISGIRDVRVFYYNPSRSQQLCAHMSEKSDNMWEGYLNFDKYVEEGTYTLWEIIATDAAGNQKDIYDTNLPSKFKIQTIKVLNTGVSDKGTNNTVIVENEKKDEINNTVIVEEEKKQENNNISVSENNNSEVVKNNDEVSSTNSESVKTDDTTSPSYEEKEVLTTGTKTETSLSNQKTENMGNIVWICLIAIAVLGIAGIVIYIKLKTNT